MFRRHLLKAAMAVGVAGTALFGAATTATAASEYPNKPVHVIVPYPAGGGTDIIGRAVGNYLSEKYNVPVIVENKPGASGIIGNDIVAKANPDGYTLLLGITALIQTPSLYDTVPYKIEDFAPISLVAKSSDLFVVHKDIPANTLDEFIQLSKDNPGQYSYGNYGNGTSSHMHGEMLKLATGADLQAIPYRGAAPLVNDALGGQVSSAFIDASSANAHIGSDRIKILGITGQTRHPELPDVATLGEQGLEGFESNGWFAVFAPAGTPGDIVNKLSQDVQAFVASDEFSARLASMGLQPVGSTAEELSAVIESDTPRWASIIERANISLN